MEDVNKPEAGSSDIFPLTAVFNDKDGKQHYRSLLGITQTMRKDEETGAELHVSGLFSGIEKATNVHTVTVQYKASDIFDECVKARQQNRYADLTKLEAIPRP